MKGHRMTPRRFDAPASQPRPQRIPRMPGLQTARIARMNARHVRRQAILFDDYSVPFNGAETLFCDALRVLRTARIRKCELRLGNRRATSTSPTCDRRFDGDARRKL